MIKLVFVDFSRTLVKQSGCNSGADVIGKGDTYRALYPEYKAGKISIDELLTKTFACWKGLEVSDLPKVCEKFEFNEGAEETVRQIKQMGIKTALLTNIPTHLAEVFAKKLGFDSYTGTVLEVKDGVFTGKVLELNNDKRKEALTILEREKIAPGEAIAIGDTKEDARVFEKIRFGVAFNGDEAARKAAKYQITDFRDLVEIIEKENKN